MGDGADAGPERGVISVGHEHGDGSRWQIVLDGDKRPLARDGQCDPARRHNRGDPGRTEQQPHAGPFAGPKPGSMMVPRGAYRSNQQAHPSWLG